jgi:enediyne biosynthesis protein E4
MKTSSKHIFPLLLCVHFLLTACTGKQAHFAALPPESTGISFVNEVADADTFNIFDYPYLYAGAGVSIGDVNNDGLDDVFLVANNVGRNRLYLNKGNFKFEDITTKAGVAGKAQWCTGSSMPDVNGDGLLDIYVNTVSIPGKLKSKNELYINKGNGVFEEGAAAYGLDFAGHATQSAFFDYDKDGDLDCFLLNHATTYTDDYKSIAVRTTVDSLSGGKLLRNDNNHFTDVTLQAGIYCAANEYGLGIAVGDINNDGWPDVYVSNDFKENDFCYLNNGDGTFREKSNELFDHVTRFSMGNDMADYNNDGWLDLITLDMLSQDEKVLKTSLADDDIEIYNYKQKNFGFYYQFSKNCLQQNISGEHFSDVSLQQGIAATDWSWAPLLADFNNDGQKDLFISNGFRYRTNDLDFTVFVQNHIKEEQQRNVMPKQFEFIRYLPKGHIPDYFYLGSSSGRFSDASATAGFTQPTLSNGTAYGDLDNDGDLDLVVNCINEPVGIYRNDFAPANYLTIHLKGNVKNTFGIGATVYAYTKAGMQCYHQSPVRGFMSSVSPVLHIGLGADAMVDSLIIIWPDGSGQRLHKIKANQKLVLLQTDAVQPFQRPVLPQAFSREWQPLAGNAGIDFIHREDEFDDLNVQPLLPHGMATEGPALATGDVNGDGREDIYVGGAKGQQCRVYLQQTDGKFRITQQPAIAADSMCEDTDALFFDADGDKDLDLYVCSGGNEYYGNQPTLPDRLYINDGKGIFQRSGGLPLLYENTSCVKACDFDKDGDLDLFVGGRTNARMFGYTPASVVLQNNEGVFREVTEAIGDGLMTVGMVTDAAWSDVDGDGWTDLLVVGEWMPVTLFKNIKGKLIRQNQLKNTRGLWQTILPADIDGDDDEDFLLGNWGANTKLTASTDFPLRLYIDDWDKNGEREPILATAKEGKYYSFYGKAELERRLPFLRKRFLKASDFAGKTIEEVFTREALKKAQLLEVTQLKHAVLKNENGKLQLEVLPDFLQAAPIFSFVQLPASNEAPEFFAAGNFYEVSPYEGRYDALMPVRFSFINRRAVMKDCLLQTGQVRKLQAAKTAQGSVLLLALNNGPLTLYQQTKKSF